ncbi:MAG: hypothetical protein L0Z53_18060 [Acidobacteriales bacterium]|nr:hypothetical protein [Terriglobales bacterium]
MLTIHQSDIKNPGVIMQAAPRVLLAGFEPAGADALAAILRDCGLVPLTAGTIPPPEDPVLKTFSLVLCSDRVFNDFNRPAERGHVPIPVVVASRLDDWDGYLKAMRKGALDYVALPPRRHEVEWVIRNVLRGSSRRGSAP